MGSQSATQSGSHNVIIQAQGDNITVNARGLPYLTLVPWQKEVRSNPQRDLDLLNPAYQSVPLTGRDADLAFLKDWVQGEGIKVTAIVGRGGAGKTRLALDFLQQLPPGWEAGFLRDREARRFLDKQNLSAWGWQQPTLIVVDYAALLGSTLNEWFAELANHEAPSRPLRILLLERHADPEAGWFHDLVAASWHGDLARALISPPDPRTIQPIEEAAQRRSILAAGLEAAHRFAPGEPLRALPAPGEDDYFDHRLADPQWADPLLLLMAAVVAIANGLPHALSLSRTELPMRLAEREARRIRDGAPSRNAGELLVHLYACVILCGDLDPEQACQVAEGEFAALHKHYPDGPGQAVDDLSRLLGAQGTLPSLAPDLLAEAFALFVFEKLPRKGVGVIARVAPFAVTRMAGVLIRTTRDYAPSGNGTPLLWLKAFVEQGESDISFLVAVEESLPLQSIAMRGLAVEVTATLIAKLDQLDLNESGLAYRARLLNNLSVRQGEMGMRRDALDSITEAVSIYRSLAEANPDAFLPDLALSLNNLSNRQSQMGLRRDALDSIAEAVGVYRSLAEVNPDAFLPDLAMSLNNLSILQGEMGLRRDALDSITEAVRIRRSLAEGNPDAFLPDLATSLNNLSILQGEMGLRRDALDSITEAVGIRRSLAEANPDAFLPDLAGSLRNLSIQQSGMGLRRDALDSITEAVSIYRSLAEANPDAFLPDLAASLNNLSLQQSEMGLRRDALDSITEAVGIRRTLAEANPDAFLPYLARSLNNLSNRQSEMGLRRDALDSITEAVGIRRSLAEANPDAFLPDLAASLNNLSNRQSGMGLRRDALDSITEAVRIYRSLAEANPDAFLPDLAMSLSVLGDRYMELEQAPEARDAAAESLQCLAPAFPRYPQSFEGLARATINDYITRTQQLGVEPDYELLAPYVSLLEKEDEP